MVFLNINGGGRSGSRQQLKYTKSLPYHLSCPNISEATGNSPGDDVIDVDDDVTDGSFYNQG